VDSLEKVRALELENPNAPGDQFLFERLDLSGQRIHFVRGVLAVLLYWGIDFVFLYLRRILGGHPLGSEWDQYVPWIPGYLPMGLLATTIAVLYVVNRRTNGARLASLWVHDKVFTLVPASKNSVSFDLPALQVKSVILSDGAFPPDRPRIRLEDTKGNRHSIMPPRDISDAGALAVYCQRLGIRFMRRRQSRVWQIGIIALFVAIALLACAVNRGHPVENMLKLPIVMAGIGILLWVSQPGE
jgi:hypothetical protein